MKIMLLLTVIFLSIPVYGQNVPIMQKSASGDEIHIDFYSACKNKLSAIPFSMFADNVEFIEENSDSYYGKNYADVQDRLPSVKKLEARLGWKPKTNLHDAIYYTLQWYEKELNK